MSMIRRATRNPLHVLLLSILIACGRSEHPTEEHPRPEPPASINIDGRYLRAWVAAAEAHRAIPDLTAKQRQLDHYMFQFSEDQDRIHILLIPKLSPDTFVTGGQTPEGRAARYEVDKKTYRVTAQTFFE